MEYKEKMQVNIARQEDFLGMGCKEALDELNTQKK